MSLFAFVDVCLHAKGAATKPYYLRCLEEVCVCMYGHMYVWIYVCVHVCVCVHVYMCACMYACVCMCVCMCGFKIIAVEGTGRLYVSDTCFIVALFLARSIPHRGSNAQSPRVVQHPW